MTQQRIDDLQKAIKTGLPIEINPKTVLELISMLETEKRRADAAVLDLERVMKLAHEWKDVDAVCEVCVTECKRTTTGTGRHFVCTVPKWRGPCASNTDAPTADGNREESK